MNDDEFRAATCRNYGRNPAEVKEIIWSWDKENNCIVEFIKYDSVIDIELEAASNDDIVSGTLDS